MKRIRHWYQSIRAYVRLRTIAFVLIAGVLAAVAVPPPAPGWWKGRHATNTNDKDDYAPLNQGQLKNLAVAAFDEFEAQFPGTGGAGEDATRLIKSWHVLDGSPPTPENPASTFRLDASGHRIPRVTVKTDDYAAVNLGQLKNVAKPFHFRLIQLGLATAYPWQGASDDYALANIGQAKNLFGFDLTRDSDKDGIPDWWELKYGLNPHRWSDAGYPAPGGLSYLDKYLLHLNPLTPDTDGDGVDDGDEIKQGRNPLKGAIADTTGVVRLSVFTPLE